MIAAPLPVLVVDDDSALLRTLSDILRLHGYAPATAGTGREGLALAADRLPALAIVDLGLPDMTGIEVASRLHALSEFTEVVVFTGNASVESAVAAFREHSVDYLVKPVDVDHLLQVASVATERWQRRQAETKLRESDERFRRVVESDMLGIMFWNADGGIYDANDEFLRIVGYSREDVAAGGLSWAAMTPAEYDQLDASKLKEVAERGVTTTFEKEYVRKDGTRVPILVGMASLEGRADRGVAFILDITDRKRAEAALEARVRQQAAVASFGQTALGAENPATLLSAAVTLVAATLDVPFVSVLERRSEGTSLMLRAGVGWAKELIGTQIVAINEETQAGYTLSRNEATIVGDMAKEQRFAGAKRLLDRDFASGVTVIIPGPVHPYGVLGAHDRIPREFSQDDIHFLTAIAHIIGTAVERHRTDTAFRQSQRMEAVGRLASGVAHDFNNMLSAITAYAELVRSGLEPASPLRGDVEEILRAADRAAGLTRQLLAFSRQQVMQPRMVRLNDIVVEMEKMLRRLIGPDIALTMTLDPDIALVRADPGQLEQVILNLCMNARDAMPAGGRLTIETGSASLEAVKTAGYSIEVAGEYVMLCISDTGIGMDAETQARMFEPFFTTKPPDKGTGLGLATVYGIVKQSGGELSVYSEVGRGTSFKVFLPRLQGITVPDEVVTPKPADLRGSETILLAEDEDAIRRAAVRILENAGYTVLVAKDGPAALRVMEEYKSTIHLLMTDMVMPGMTGRELAGHARVLRPLLRTLYLSGFTDTTVTHDQLIDQGVHFLQKPFGTATLARKVREALDTPIIA